MGLRGRTLAVDHLWAASPKFRGLHLPRIIGDYHLRPPPDEESKSRIGELAQLIERMGSVNLDAMREHEEAEKRYAFYTEQMGDLEKAAADLERAIQQMNKESKRLFLRDLQPRKTTSSKEDLPANVPRRARTVAPHAANPDDLLETGIDIPRAAAGQEALQHIELAGRRWREGAHGRLLIFALFQFRPSPFCILDESTRRSTKPTSLVTA
ncbi:MAG: hypothetical protein U0235_25815 [Polyangiaceae bacterium]